MATALRAVLDIDIPSTTSHVALVAHTRRVADLTTACGRAATGSTVYAGHYGTILALGVAMSWRLDLGMFREEDGRMITLRGMREQVWPGQPKASWRIKDALKGDCPRYDGGRADWDAPCPIPGPRGGACWKPGRQWVRWVADTETGEWVDRQVCPFHMDAARERANRSPDPKPNAGGVLQAVFPELDIPKMYRWANPRWTPPGEPVAPDPVLARPVLRLVEPGAAS